ncbi:MAG TPA: fumarylacetoacetate hydrolase family protein [Flavobacteriales bacterium]|nr:fumarylacetoacetate hydrolase family protein [Flavobacteriales bacterium]
MKIICIGRNYGEHAKELGNALPDKPVFFLKPDTALLGKGQDFYYPDFTKDLHHEIEVVVKISKNGKNIDEKFAANYYNEIGLGIDFTARDLQDEAKKKGLPWEIAKAFDNAAVVGNEFVPVSAFENLQNINFHLTIQDKTVQVGNTSNMIFNINYLIAYVSRFITLKQGDLLFTGTPSGVGPVKIGDNLTGYLENRKLLGFFIK